MGKSKSELFSERQNALADLAKALSHPARIAILEQIMKKGSCVCGELVSDLPLSQATISQHLKAMKDAGIIVGNTEGVFTCYCIDRASCQNLLHMMGQFFQRIKQCC